MNDADEKSPGLEAESCDVVSLAPLSLAVRSNIAAQQQNEFLAEIMTADSEQESTDERLLIARVLSGEKNEFRHLVVMHQDRIYALIVRQTGDPTTAKDLCQEVFIRAYKHLGKFRGDARFSTWLIRIALNVVNSYFSSRGYRNKMRAQEIDESKLTAEESGETAKREHEHSHLRLFISQLPEKYRDVIVLCSVEQKSYEEAAFILAIAPGTVGSRLNKAYSLLRKKYQRAGYETI